MEYWLSTETGKRESRTLRGKRELEIGERQESFKERNLETRGRDRIGGVTSNIAVPNFEFQRAIISRRNPALSAVATAGLFFVQRRQNRTAVESEGRRTFAYSKIMAFARTSDAITHSTSIGLWKYVSRFRIVLVAVVLAVALGAMRELGLSSEEVVIGYYPTIITAFGEVDSLPSVVEVETASRNGKKRTWVTCLLLAALLFSFSLIVVSQVFGKLIMSRAQLACINSIIEQAEILDTVASIRRRETFLGDTAFTRLTGYLSAPTPGLRNTTR
ncbi:uncharacterized protein BDR25DRAFT_358895 [Lindgomyces ingoldianus]|uniref:Uncharacterized protein n=1 Tax=Lindgomyces ingoldianus TaxID=673940 RepID=A0ACB6QK19_9PLEO|nr:uncharacterized protein BDR25DRAFT_358895 [Lindgomyces ingoldianus]KAF2467369.1 hypothetical protein BDR25DRAFT_358895 [Lindgomyces ingoldianus]